MVTLEFSLTPEASVRLHDVIACLSKFSDEVSIEAQKDTLALTALNSSKSAHASFTLNQSFFQSYDFCSGSGGTDGRFTCSILNKALLSCFKGRLADARSGDTAIDRCEVSLQDLPGQTECRLVIRMVCNHGVTKTYKLTYESTEVMRALFNKSESTNQWSIPSTYLKEFTEFFGPKTEQLDITYEDGKMTFTSFTEKVMNTKHEVLKHPLQTAVSVNTTDFEKFSVLENLRIEISVKDFKAIVAHADSLKTVLSAYYSHPTRPLQFSYSSTDGLLCEFTLMTRGEHRGTPAVAPANTIPSRQSTRSSSTATTSTIQPAVSMEMPPPAVPADRKQIRKLGRSTVPAQLVSQVQAPQRDEDSLFVQQDEDDRRWEPRSFEGEEQEDVLGWDASGDHDAGYHPTFRDRGTLARSETTNSAEGMPPTQRVSEVKGLW